LRILQLKVAEEEALVLSELSATLSPHADEILWAQEVCVRADLLAACVKFAQAIDARVVPFGEPGTLSLKQARHPLLCLEGAKVVANDLELSAAAGLVLSGPNAGGKTVALKTLGLMALMQSSGLPVPVDEESSIGFFSEVLSDIGDDQSLAMSLSTFSGHIQRVATILSEAAHGTLVLFDELMGGTDPNEGAALAIATIDALVEAGAAVCVTTHYEALKEHAAGAPNIQNAAVGFDFTKMEPTFTVELGRPGASSAFIVAERYGLAGSITKRAEQILPDVLSETRRDRLELEQQALLLRQERERLKAAVAEHELETRRLTLEREKAKEARIKDLGRESDALRSEVAQARSQLRSLSQRLKSAAGGDLKEMEREIARASAVVSLGSPADREVRGAVSEGAELSLGSLEVGSLVFVKGFSSPAKVLEAPKKGHVRVLAGVMKMSVPVSELEHRKGEVQSSGPKRTASVPHKVKEVLPANTGQRPAPVKSQDVTLDLRGRRIEESLLELDSFIDELLRRQENGAFVLHGHGTGALKEAVRQHLRAHSCIAESRASERDDGGDAWTTFWLRM
jgi:DNA mismatch repair protein MutS2